MSSRIFESEGKGAGSAGRKEEEEEEHYSDELGEDEEHDLQELEEREGYELKAIRRDGQHTATTAGAERYDNDSYSLEDEDHTTEERRNEEEDGDHMLLHPERRRTETWTPSEESVIVRKLDRNLVFFVAFLYMLSFLDRGNLGNAKLAGLTSDLQISHFSSLLTAFYTPYILFQPLSHLYTIVPAHIHLTAIVLSWGIISSLQALCTSSTPLLILRFLLGVAEAAFAGIPIYLSTFFKREELAFRMGIFIAAAPLASSFAGTLAMGILAFGDKVPIANWRLLFLIEGFPAVLISLLVWHWIPDSPASARWLTERERKVARRRLRTAASHSSKAVKRTKDRGRINWKAALAPLRDPKAYLLASLFFAVNVSFASLPVFLPTILEAMGFGPLASQGLTAPPYLCAVVSILVTARLSDRMRSRSGPLMFHSTIAFLGFLVLATAERTGLGEWARYAAVFPIASGLFSCVAGIITWQVNNEGTKEGKGTGFAVLQMVGQCGSLVGSGLFPDAQGPFWGKGMRACAGGMVWVGVGSLGLRWWLGRENRMKRGGERYLL